MSSWCRPGTLLILHKRRHRHTLLVMLQAKPACALMVIVPAQESAVRIMQGKDKRSQAGELQRLQDYELARMHVRLANRNFQRLERLQGAAQALTNASRGKDGRERLRAHVSFCNNLDGKIEVVLQQVGFSGSLVGAAPLQVWGICFSRTS